MLWHELSLTGLHDKKPYLPPAPHHHIGQEYSRYAFETILLFSFTVRLRLYQMIQAALAIGGRHPQHTFDGGIQRDGLERLG